MPDKAFVPGYHLVPIRKGVLGELSKVQEELDELTDGYVQKDRILMSVELADLYGAMQLYLTKHQPMYSMDDIAQLAAETSCPKPGELASLQEALDQLALDHAERSPMACMALASLLTALELFAHTHLPGLTLSDIARFSVTTQRAFTYGRR